jgi:hypothetical protein
MFLSVFLLKHTQKVLRHILFLLKQNFKKCSCPKCWYINPHPNMELSIIKRACSSVVAQPTGQGHVLGSIPSLSKAFTFNMGIWKSSLTLKVKFALRVRTR